MKYVFPFLLLMLLVSCTTKRRIMLSQIDQSHALRLLPGQDLRSGIQNYINEHKVKAGWVVTCVGSLTEYNIRFANAPEGTKGSGHFEIVSLSGTLSKNGSHIHISISDSTGKTIGGHLLEGCKIYTTAEIIIHESSKYIFTRQKDGTTPWEELQINKTVN
jgi:predicted DNA-binding protein with PD1-like motif